MSKLRFAVFVSGGGTNLQALIDGIREGHIQGEIPVVISDKDGAYALERARMNGIRAVSISRNQYQDKVQRENVMLSTLYKEKVDFIVLAGYLSILSGEVLSLYKGRIINLHPSLIPNYCGKGMYGDRVHQAVLDAGEKETGVTIHYVDEGIDTGAIIVQEKLAVLADDTVESLRGRVHAVEHRILTETVAAYCRGDKQFAHAD